MKTHPSLPRRTPQGSPTNACSDRPGDGRILIAEDDPSVLELAVRMLTSAGYAVEGVEDGEAAWAALNRERFDLLITDHGMPRLSGLELLKRVRSARMDLPVLMASGMMPAEALNRDSPLRLQDRLLKPYSAAELLRRVTGLLGPAAKPVATKRKAPAHNARKQPMAAGLPADRGEWGAELSDDGWVVGEATDRTAAIFPSGVVTLTEGNFPAEVRQSAVPVLVLFWADWCGRCKIIGPALDELAAHYDSRVKIARINVDEQPTLAGDYGIRAIPTLLLLRRGEVAGQMVGPRSRQDLEDCVGRLGD